MTQGERLPKLKFLDPRCEADARTRPLEGAVNIPLDELPSRTYELPPKSETIEVVGHKSLADQAILALASSGRSAVYAGEGRPAEKPHCVGRLWSPNGLLASIMPSLSPGRALDVGCGSGRDAVYLAAHGWQVHGIDNLPDAIVKANTLASRLLPPGELPLFTAIDALGFQPPSPYELICCFFYFNACLAKKLTTWLIPGGSLIIEHFSPKHKQAFGRPKGDLFERDELVRVFAGLELRHYEEGEHDGRFTFRLWCTAPMA